MMKNVDIKHLFTCKCISAGGKRLSTILSKGNSLIPVLISCKLKFAYSICFCSRTKSPIKLL